MHYEVSHDKTTALMVQQGLTYFSDVLFKHFKLTDRQLT